MGSIELDFWSRLHRAYWHNNVPIVTVENVEDIMGVKELRDAFNEVTGIKANCIKALMEYARTDTGEMQALYFSGNFADGTPFVIESDLVPPSGNLLAASQETARKLLQGR